MRFAKQCLFAISILCASAVVAQTSLTTLHDFSGGDGDGAHPLGDLSMDGHGVIYGTVGPGGRRAQIYSLTPPAFTNGSWTKSVLYIASFTAPVQDDLSPVIVGPYGELYGTSDHCLGISFGCVFELAPTASGGWAMLEIHGFEGAAQGDGKRVALGKLAMDAAGNLYGVTQSGGLGNDVHSGTIYELIRPASPGGFWTEQILYEFQNVRGGFYYPQMNVAIDRHGALFGSTRFSRNQRGDRAAGVIYQLAPPAVPGNAWTISVINRSIGGSSVTRPGASQLTVGPGGTVFGVSRLAGGAFALKPPSVAGRPWTLVHLPSSSGGGPGSELARDSRGNLYGTDGQSVYKIAPPLARGGAWTYSVLHTFAGGSEGSVPSGRPLVDASGGCLGQHREAVPAPARITVPEYPVAERCSSCSKAGT